MAENSHKIKLLRLYDLLRKETDPDHPISRIALNQRLNDLGIPSNVRTLSRDIECLNEFGYEVMGELKDKEKYYYVPEHDFSVPEIKILMDAVMAATFVTEKKTTDLIEKIASLGGYYGSESLKRTQVFYNTRKHSNEKILYIVDSLEEAMRKKKKVAFHYFDLDSNAQRVYRLKDTGEKKRYYVEPIALIYNEDNYYLMTYSSRHPETTANYRVDRMDQVEVVEESVLSDEAQAKIATVAEYTEQVFKMYNGEKVAVVLEFDKCLIGPVFDKFGEDTKMMPITEDRYAATVNVQISPTFFGWVAQFSDKMRILSPESTKNQYKEHINKIFGQSEEPLC
ncbi:MAG: WYL domain-containing protein [Clostridia bacterium]|nr:WYL domain-containing protein [Clostridia bacterium]